MAHAFVHGRQADNGPGELHDKHLRLGVVAGLHRCLFLMPLCGEVSVYWHALLLVQGVTRVR